MSTTGYDRRTVGLRHLSIFFALGTLGGCGRTEPWDDAPGDRRDAGPDAGSDAGTDAGSDAGPDAGDGGSDAGPDGGIDAGEDAGPDGGADGGPECEGASDCDDGVFCNGAETCLGGVCASGLPVFCDDGVACTVDGCDERVDRCVGSPVNARCDDGAFCDGQETCDVVRGCVDGEDPICDDGVACTVDACDEATDRCRVTADHARCDDGAFCNGPETCNLARGCVAGAPPVCDDDVLCTTDACDEAGDRCTATPVDAACDDGLFCDGTETCDARRGCVDGPRPICNDGIACTTDACDEAGDRCTTTPVDAACSDGLFCDGAETCDARRGCVDGPDPICNDGIACTNDACDEAGDRCTVVPVDARCSNGLFCDGVENCDAVRGCVDGPDPACNDGIACTTDACDEAGDRCRVTPVDALCSDGLFCDGVENCDAVRGCVDGPDPACNDGVDCTTDACDEGGDRCGAVPDDARCDDGRFCTGAETCDAVLGCQAGTVPDCTDAVSCTIDFCGPRVDRCVNLPIDLLCDDGLLCDGDETCDPDFDCQPGDPLDCDDFVDCTVDACDEGVGGCTSAPDDAACDDGLVCDGDELCDPFADCQPGLPPDCDDFVDCTVDACDEGAGGCTSAPDDAACDDGLSCDGSETCDAAFDCQPGAPTDCDDFVDCTDDSCDEGLGCLHDPNDANCPPGEICDAALDCQAPVECFVDPDCDDGLFCTGVETCVGGVCQAGTPPVCDDGVDCTFDFCEPFADDCVPFEDDAACDDGLDCNGFETCDQALGCLPDTPVDCDDFVDCTDDSCDEALGCLHEPNDANCRPGQVCDPFDGCL